MLLSICCCNITQGMTWILWKLLMDGASSLFDRSRARIGTDFSSSFQCYIMKLSTTSKCLWNNTIICMYVWHFFLNDTRTQICIIQKFALSIEKLQVGPQKQVPITTHWESRCPAFTSRLPLGL